MSWFLPFPYLQSRRKQVRPVAELEEQESSVPFLCSVAGPANGKASALCPRAHLKKSCMLRRRAVIVCTGPQPARRV